MNVYRLWRILTLVLLLLLAVSAPGWAGPMDPTLIKAVGAGWTTEVAIQDHYAFCASRGGLTVFDLAAPSAPTLVASLDLPGEATGLAISGAYAYVAARAAGLLAVDISDPLHPALASQAADESLPDRVMLIDHYAYAIDSMGGVTVFDLTDPAHPAFVSHLALSDGTGYDYAWRDVGLVGSALLIAANPSSCWVVDVTDPAAPSQVGSFDLATNALGVAVYGSTAYLADEDELVVVDVSNPLAPVRLGAVASTGLTGDMAIIGDRLYVHERWLYFMPGPDVLHVFDLADPLHPVELAPFMSDQPLTSLTPTGDLLCAGALVQGVVVYDATTDPPVVLGAGSYPGGLFAIGRGGDQVYAVDFWNVYAYDMTGPFAPEILNVLHHPYFVAKMIPDGDRVYLLADPYSGPDTFGLLHIVDSPGAGEVQEVFAGSPGGGTWIDDLVLSGSYGYVSDHTVGPDGTIRVIDFSDPAVPQQVATCEGAAGVLALSGPYLYAADPDGSTLRVLDISNPTAPVIINTVTGSATEASATRRLSVEGGRLYLFDKAFGEAIFDLSDPTTPVRVGGYVPTPMDNLYDFVPSGYYGYVTTRDALRVLDLSDPATPVELGQYPLWNTWMPGDFPGDVLVMGDTLLLADGGRGLVVLTNPIVFTDVATDFWAYDAIHACYAAGIVTGYQDNTYGPKGVVTRGQMAAFLARAMCGGDDLVPTGPSTATFPDVPVGSAFFRHVEYAHDQGVVKGYQDGSYQPTWTVNRGQMAAFLARALVGGEEFVPTGPPTASFSDAPTSYGFYNHVEYIYAQGITTGYGDGTFHPEYACNRDQMAVFVARAFHLLP